MSHSVSVGPDNSVFSPMKFVSRPTISKTSSLQFDLWNAGGNDFPSPNKLPKIRQESPVKSMCDSHVSISNFYIGQRALLHLFLRDRLLGDRRLLEIPR
jgi:hypothetical protein